MLSLSLLTFCLSSVWILTSFSIVYNAFSYNLSSKLAFDVSFVSIFSKLITTLWSIGKSPTYKSSLKRRISSDSNLSLLLIHLLILMALIYSFIYFNLLLISNTFTFSFSIINTFSFSNFPLPFWLLLLILNKHPISISQRTAFVLLFIESDLNILSGW